MNTSTVPSTDQNRMKSQDIRLLPWAVTAIFLTMLLLAWTPAKASPAVTGGQDRSTEKNLTVKRAVFGSGCSAYWEYFFAQIPDGPQVAQPPCPPDTSEVNQLDSGASLYWEFFLANDTGTGSPQIAQITLLPVTGEITRSASGVSLYWEYFLVYSPNGPQIDKFSFPPATEEVSQP